VDVGAPGTIPGATFVPAKPGDYLTLYATGLGPTNPAFAAGVLPTTAGQITSSIQVTVGGILLPAAAVQYAGVTPGDAGLYQVNIQLPASTPNGNLPVVMTVNGTSSPSGAYIAVQQ
jgi:uncharacterized protein (TIGR03437 family)